MNNFWQRLFTGIIFVIAIIGGMWWHPYSYLAIFFIVVILGLLEFIKLVEARPVSINRTWPIILGAYWYLSSFFVLGGFVSPLWLMLIVPMIMGVFITELFRNSTTPLLNIACTLIIPFYVALPFSFLHFLVYLNGAYCYMPLLGFFILIWANDSGAYLVGVNFGKNKLFERISPKKTWEGTIGGFIFTVISAYALSLLIKDVSTLNWLIIGIIVSIMGSLGDLVESMLKRSVNIKDSGSLLPGHGGILDRFDAVIFAAPLVCTYLFLTQILN
ncbi:phosphatidate cytidylyltransferase [Alkalitalea saponilacus]|uniref:Phosphatidate cytidylyltransferase n=1 Tax=Alkalitalea saponilacus TaxID=889453 RepID=A0A1T5AHQ2_9BACT|nr:phosphatidate cytidylyltransferase [Alkalitalea saponilacus]ASB48697.1 phosphatidate cytidylyltransferase [Alkalitalea saponilacus]SKB34476.1 phosphatidate cytidylyltransferase [Alkalitalea saponilacus]